MSSQSILVSHDCGLLGSTAYGLHAMTSASASIAFSFRPANGLAAGLDVGFHASTDQVRAFAADMLRFADAADAALAGSEIAA